MTGPRRDLVIDPQHRTAVSLYHRSVKSPRCHHISRLSLTNVMLWLRYCNIEFGTGKVATKVRAEDLDANMSKISVPWS